MRTRHWTKNAENRRIYLAVLALFLLGAGLRGNLQALMMNDEILYFSASLQHAGLFYAAPINPAHPPLAKLFFAASCIFQDCNYDAFQWYGYGYPLPMAYAPIADAVRAVLPGMRAVSALFSLALAAVVFHYAKKWFGAKAGLFALFMALVSPNALLYADVVMLESAFLFFFTAAFFFYLGTYRARRTVANGALLGLLVAAALLCRQFIPFALFPLILVPEILDAMHGRKSDGRLLFFLALALLVFFALYPPGLFLHETGGFLAVGNPSGHIQLKLVLTLLQRIELPVLAGGAALVVFRKRLRKNTPMAVLAAAVIFGFGAAALLPENYSAFRYALFLFPSAYVLAGAGFSLLRRELEVAVVLAACALLLVQSSNAYPYFEQFTGIPGMPVADIERIPEMGVHSFLLAHPQPNTTTNDFYALPYAFDLNISYVFQIGAPAEPSPRFPCANRTYIAKRLAQKKVSHFVFRKNAIEYLVDCPALDQAVQTHPKAYEDAEFAVFDLRR